ncbi:hypothetical protein PQX77_011559 [Marasmius sp. AFHP31]|nr:hypothetical protein PQX77_011559 [Marasmius sp. AFHP31]
MVSYGAEAKLGMSQPTNFGDTLSSGIQDVAALLPLLGTEQCERHVGTALEKGYIYAAATPLSIFGSLGIVKTAFATLIATTTRPFYGGDWLDDAGFGTSGSVSSMVTLVKDTQQYGAEVQLKRLMEEQHIDDPDLIADIGWFGWEKRKPVDGTLLPCSWNISLILTSSLSSLVSISPYLYLIHNSWGSATLWLFPLLRSFGALLCVVSIQLALQIRIHRITTASLLLMKARKRSPLPTEEAIKDRDMLLEARLRSLRVEPSDLENQLISGHQTDLRSAAEAHSQSQDILLPLLQVILVVGMGMTVAGYVGCFNIVGRTNVDAGPYVWFGMETLLAVLRIALWGWNPRWDEGGTGMTMRLALRNRDLIPDDKTSCNFVQRTSPLHVIPEGSPGNPKTPVAAFPLITTPRFLSQFYEASRITWWGWHWYKASLIVENIEDFLAASTPYVGPLPRLQSEELKGISLYCAIVPDGERKLLCTTACRDDSKWTSISILIGGDTAPYMYTSRSQDLPGARALRVNLQNKIQKDSVTVIDGRALDLLIDYSSRLFGRLCMADNSSSGLPLSWKVTLPDPSSLPKSINMQKSILLTEKDKAYIQTRQVHDLKREYRINQDNLLLGVFPFNYTPKRHDELVEWALILNSAIMEVYLCILEHQFVQSLSLSSAQSRRLALEWIRDMEDRILLEKEDCRGRQKGAVYITRFKYETRYSQLVQELQSLRQLPIGDIVLTSWKESIDIIMDQPDTVPAASDLFGHPLLQNLDLEAIRPFFVAGSPDEPSRAYRNMIAFFRSSLCRLRDVKASSLHDPINPWDPGSLEFSPPYTRVGKVSKATSEALAEQIKATQMIELCESHVQKTLLEALKLLHSLPSSQSLTTVMFRYAWLDTEATHLVTSILQRHPESLYLAFQDCELGDRALIDDSITKKRQKWKEDAQSEGIFKYSVGCEIRPGDYTDNTPCTIYQRDILLSDCADLCAMLYLPHSGKLVPKLSLQAYLENITLDISLIALDRAGEAREDDSVITLRGDVTVSYTRKTALSL